MAGENMGALIPTLTAIGAMNGEQIDPGALAAPDPRLDRVLNAATDTVAPNDGRDWKNENLAFAGGIAANPLGGVLSGFGAQVGQRNKQAELLGQYLPIIAPVLQQQKFLEMQARQAQMAFGPPGATGPLANGAAAMNGGMSTPGAVGASAGAPGASGAPPVQPMQQPNMFGTIPNRVASQALALGQSGPLTQAYMEQFKPTPETLSAWQAGVNPQDANYVKLLGMMKPDTIGRSGVVYQPTPQGPRFFGVPTSMPTGMVPNVDVNGNSLGAHMLGGVTGGLTATTAAEKQGSNQQTVTIGYDNDTGEPITMTQDQLVQIARGNGLGGSGGNGRYPGAQSQPGVNAKRITPSLGPGEETAQRGQAEGAVKLYNNDASMANGFAGRMFTLQKALTGLQGADTGRGSETVNDLRNFLTAQSPDVMKKFIPGYDAMAVKNANYDEANKYLMQYAMAQAGAMGQGTDEKLAAALSGNANTHINNLAAQDVVRANMGLERMRQAQVEAFNQSGQSQRGYQRFATQWNADVDPRVFIWDTLPQDKKILMRDSMSAQEMSKFTAQYKWALQNKYINGSP